MADRFAFLFTADGDQILTADGDEVAVLNPGFELLLNFLRDLRQTALDQGMLPSMKAQGYDTNRGKRLHKQFWVSGRLVSSSAISQGSDNVWEIVFHMAWQPTVGRSDVDFGFYELFDFIATVNNAWQSKLCATWNEPVNVSSATPEWNDDLKAWDVSINVATQERRSWAPTS